MHTPHAVKFLLAVTLLCAACSALPVERAAAREHAVVGGVIDDTSKAVVGLGIGINNFFAGHCTGTLIAPNLILTARHCVALTSSPGQPGSVVCGKTPFTLQGSGELFRATTLTVRPEKDGGEFYKGVGKVWVDKSATDICGFDIALIVLDGKGIPASETAPIEPRIEEPATTGEVMSGVGYGLTQAGGSESGTRMRIDARKVVCTKSGCTGSLVTEREFGTDAPTCQGDSGGPAIDSQGRVFGVLSRGPQGCSSSVYGDVAANKDLIVSAALFAAKSGGYDPPAWAKKYAPDAGVGDGATEAGAGVDGSATSDGANQGGGSGCAVALGAKRRDPASASLGTVLPLLLLAAWLVVRRRS